MARLKIPRYGTRAEVMHGKARMTQGRLRKEDLTYNEYGQIHGFSGRDMTKNSDKPKWKHMGKKSGWVYPAYVPTKEGAYHDCMTQDYVIIVESIGDCLNLINTLLG